MALAFEPVNPTAPAACCILDPHAGKHPAFFLQAPEYRRASTMTLKAGRFCRRLG